MIAEFLAWYGRQMQDALAGLLTPRAAPLQDGWVITDDGASLTVALHRRGRAGPVLGLDAAPVPNGATVALALPNARPLVRDVRVPAAAAGNLAAVLAFDMDRLTPFPVASVAWTHAVTGHDRGRGELLVRLYLMPRARFAATAAALPQCGWTIGALLAPTPDGLRRLDLLPPDDTALARRRRSAANAWYACSALAAGVLIVPLVQTSLRLDATAAEIARLRPQMARADALRRQITGEGSGADALAAAREQAGHALHALAALTDALPDDTYLTGLTIKGDKLALAGQSAASTKLIAALSVQPGLRNPSFAAPVVRTQSQAEIFAIQAEAGP